MRNGIRSLPRYQEGGPHPRGLRSLPQELSWTRELGIPERVEAPSLSVWNQYLEELPPLYTRTDWERAILSLKDFDRMAPVRASILETPPRIPGWGITGGGPSRSAADVREQFARRNPDAPVGPGGGEIEDVLLEIMDADITEQEILQALDDPMFGGPISGTASNAEIDERVYGRRYANKMEEIRDRAVAPWRRGHTVNPPLPPMEMPLRTRLARISTGIGKAARGAGITTLKAIRNRLPAIVAAGAATAAASHPVSALADVALSPTELGLGELSEESRFSPEEKVKYYDELMNLGRELGVGRHRPSILQLSREINGPSIRSSYPMGR